MAVQGSRTRLLKRLPTRMLSSALEEPIFQSYLFKQSHIFDAFNKRYFILFQGYLVYYVSEEEYKSDHKHGHLAHRHGAIKLNDLYLSKPEKKPRGAKYIFVLHAPHKANKRHEYLLVGQSRELRNKWMIKLQEQNPNLVEHASHNTPDMAKYRKGSLDPTHLHGIHVEQENHEEPVIEESEELSDHERHEPDEEEDETSGFLGDHNHSSEVQ